MKRILIFALALTLFALPASAAVPRIFNIQGVLTDNTGTALPDATYEVDFLLWNTIFGGSIVWSEAHSITQSNGVFEAILGHSVSLEPDLFDRRLWLNMQIDGGPATMPRIEMTSVTSALIAAAVEPGAAVRSLNGMTDNMVLAAGANVSITQVDTTLIISATAGPGGDDGDWTIAGNNLFRTSTGSVAIGTNQAHTLGDWSINTTMQVSAALASALCLDITVPTLSRASISHSSQGLFFGWTDDYATNSTQAYRMAPGVFQTFAPSGNTAIQLHSGDDLTSGSQLLLYGTSSATVPAIVLDTQTGTGASQIGGFMQLRNSAGNTVVTVTANHNGTGIGRVTTPVLEITGGSDLSEQFDLGDVSAISEPGMVVSIDPESPGQLTLSGKAYDRRVAGVISGAGGVNTGMVMGQAGSVADGEHPVALVGRVYVWADASNGPIEPGDLLTTAERPGHAMKVTDHTLATGAILGKAMTGLTAGQGLILTLVSLQ